MTDAMQRLAALQGRDLPVHGGRTLAYVYDSGDPEVDRVGWFTVAHARTKLLAGQRPLLDRLLAAVNG